MASLRNLFNTAGRKGLPDLGVSELLGYSKGAFDPANQQVFNAPYGFSPNQAQQQEILQRPELSSQQPIGPVQSSGTFYSTPVSSQNPAGVTPTGGSGGGTGSAPSNALSAGGQVAGITDQFYQDEQNRLNAEAERRSQDARNQASSIFNPLITNAQTQIGRLGEELGQLRGGIEQGARAGRELVGSQLQQALNTLGQQEQNVRGETQKSLRSLAEDQRSMTTSLARQLGSRGAGDTSAGDYSSAAIGRQGLKQRGSALESQATGLREIEGRRIQSQEIANQEINRIEQAKQQQLTSLAADFQRLNRELESVKATASSDEQRFIAEQQNSLRDQLSQRLSDLENESRQRKVALNDWYARQEYELSQSLAKVSRAGSYNANPLLAQLTKYAKLTGGTISPAAIQQIDPTFDPSMLTYDQPTEEEEDPLDTLINNALQGGTQQPQSQGVIPDNIPFLGRF